METPARPTCLIQLGRLAQETLSPGYSAAGTTCAQCPIAGQEEDVSDLKDPLFTSDGASSSTSLACRQQSFQRIIWPLNLLHRVWRRHINTCIIYVCTCRASISSSKSSMKRSVTASTLLIF